jgi:hypothetical protein
MSKRKESKYDSLRGEIAELLQNHSVADIYKILSNKYPEKELAYSSLRGYVNENGLRGESVVDETLHRGNLSGQPWTAAWIKDSETGVSVLVKNVEEILEEENIENIIKEAVKEFKPLSIPPVKKKTTHALRGVISDAHVGMESNTEDAMFGFEYNEKVFQSHLSKFYEALYRKYEAFGVFDTLFIDDLGDGLDGLHGETTRGGHKLPQNMTNREAFNVYVKGRIDLANKIATSGMGEKYVFRSVTNDNHSDVFAWMAHRAVQIYCEQTLPNVEYVILNKPIEHFYYGKHCFLLTHGKDARLMKKNWPLHITPTVENIIRDYIDHYNIDAEYIHLDKGDLHTIGYDSRPKFDYRNFMSFAPPSSWVQSNFGVSYCGFSIQVIPQDSNEIQHTDIKFELKKV